jgi:hypothetical protein
MKAVFVAGLAGVLVGAGLVTLTARAPAAPPAPPRPVAERAARGGAAPVPPGWDVRYLSRLAAVEAKVAGMETTAPHDSAAPQPTPQLTDRARDIEEQYREELAILERNLQQHASEAVDATWAPGQSASIRDELTAIVPKEHAFKVDDIDCRSRTCVAQLVYDTPDDALQGRAAIHDALVNGCHGISATLTPPTSPGPYRTSLIYTCR